MSPSTWLDRYDSLRWLMTWLQDPLAWHTGQQDGDRLCYCNALWSMGCCKGLAHNLGPGYEIFSFWWRMGKTWGPPTGKCFYSVEHLLTKPHVRSPIFTMCILHGHGHLLANHSCLFRLMVTGLWLWRVFGSICAFKNEAVSDLFYFLWKNCGENVHYQGGLWVCCV